MKQYWIDAEIAGVPVFIVIVFLAVVIFGGIKYQRGFDKDTGKKTKIDWKPIVRWVGYSLIAFGLIILTFKYLVPLFV